MGKRLGGLAKEYKPLFKFDEKMLKLRSPNGRYTNQYQRFENIVFYHIYGDVGAARHDIPYQKKLNEVNRKVHNIITECGGKIGFFYTQRYSNQCHINCEPENQQNLIEQLESWIIVMKLTS